MNKKYISTVAVTFVLASGAAYAGFNNKSTSAVDDRTVIVGENTEQTKLLKEILAETKRTNELLVKYIGAGGEAERRQRGALPEEGKVEKDALPPTGEEPAATGGRRERIR
ncbi:MAG: hypothetical protein PQ612_07295 [Rickettsiales bacterium]|nr:hypothetical protein [Pseudomonadota bacterium]MDA0965728.1 hypothetical protein [Pseudomonadota bacterium]MDG4543810.1 hypothetical protein [Rickettsiales bacterium]MDG4545957.1 hypothetical protein [Rickettsiales bacterium]MDG4548203.1 hypothetical protein [Rickettsiales bacterium]